jgi:Mg-chelatase subunit ChlD
VRRARWARIARAVVLIGAIALPFRAGENQENLINGQANIIERFWVPAAFPLDWRFHDAGVVNNANIDPSTPAVSNADAQAAVTSAFAAWQGVSSARVSFAFGGETPDGTTGFDGVNLITWSDPADFTTNPNHIGRGNTTVYVGAAIVLNDANRTVTIGSPAQTSTLSSTIYPNGTTLNPGTIVDMDMSFNAVNFDFVTTPNAVPAVANIQSIATHEFGHMLGLAHSSLSFSGTERATMFPSVSTNSVSDQNAILSLELDDQVAVSRTYPGNGFWPTGTAPFATGAISGGVFDSDGVTAAQGLRIWAWPAGDTSHPVVETFTATDKEIDPVAIPAGSYLLPGLPPGDYFVTVMPWNNGIQTAAASNPASNNFNRTATNFSVPTFTTETYDDILSPSGNGAASFAGATRVAVTAGATTPKINFILGAEQTDFMLVMDKSGSMNGPSGVPGVTKIQALRDAADEFVDFLALAGGHRLGLVAFDSAVSTLSPPNALRPLDATAQSEAHTAIGALTAGGATNIIAGVTEGVDELGAVAAPNPRQVLLLFSDGHHNTPAGSNVLDIVPLMADNDVQCYSVGFGPDVDDTAMQQAASQTGGAHVNQVDLDPLGLRKHFLAVAASAVDASVVVDPLFTVAPGRSATVSVETGPADRNLTVAVNWLDPAVQPQDVTVKLEGPGGVTVPATVSGPGHRRASGAKYHLVRVSLPFAPGTSGGAGASAGAGAGTWKITVSSNRRVDVDVSVYGRGAARLRVDVPDTARGRLLIARLPWKGELVRGLTVTAEVGRPSTRKPSPLDKQDTQFPRPDPTPFKPETIRPALEKLRGKPTLMLLTDDGRNGDAKKGDGIYSALLTAAKPGIYPVRIVARGTAAGRPIRRELTTTVVVK